VASIVESLNLTFFASFLVLPRITLTVRGDLLACKKQD